MMKLRKAASVTPIGLDIGARRIKAMQCRSAGEEQEIVAAANFERREHGEVLTAAEAQRIVQALERQGFEGRRIVLGLPTRCLITSMLEAPAMKAGVPVAQIARLEFARMHDLSPQSFELGWWPLPTQGRGASHILAVGCKHADCEPLVDALEGAGLDVMLAGPAAPAMASLSGELVGEEAGLIIMLDVGWHAATLQLVYKQTLVYERVLSECGMATLDRTLAEELGLDDLALRTRLIAEMWSSRPAGIPANLTERLAGHASNFVRQLARELDVSVSYAMHQYRDVEHYELHCHGGLSGMGGFVGRLGRETQIDVRVPRLTDAMACPDHLLGMCSDGTMVRAYGLACMGRAA